MREEQTYTTSDLGLAAALMTLRYVFLEIDTTDPKYVFVFESDSSINHIAAAYFSSDLSVDALTLAMNIKRLKALVFQEKTKKTEE